MNPIPTDTLPQPAPTVSADSPTAALGAPGPPGERQAAATPAPLTPEDLVDPFTGVIRSVREVPHPPGAPAAYLALTASVADARMLGEWPADRVSLGTSFGDASAARIAAIAEGAERYCGNFLPDPLPPHDFFTGTRGELVGSGHPALETHELPTHATWQARRPGFPYTTLGEDTPALWARCLDDGGNEVWVPDALVHLNWRQARFRHLPRTHHLNYAGIATGQGVQDARDRGLLEVIERDALELWWHLDGPARGIDVDSVPGLRQDLEGCALEVWLVQMPSEFAPCVAALTFDAARGIYAAGFSCALDPARAARKAVLEAVHTWIYTQGTLEADGWVYRAVERGLMARGLYLEHRPERDYAAQAGAQFENVIDLGAHVQVWLDPSVHALAARFREPALGTVGVEALESPTLGQVRARLAAGGHREIYRDLTTRDVAMTPLRVVRTLVTGLVPNAPAAFAYLGMDRFASAARERGWPVPRQGPEGFTLVPPPHM
ncbi:MAG: YcaO-like family protein [Arthrobacter sp.]|nr:YcaO-like family protein [Arthrobacter sp.]